MEEGLLDDVLDTVLGDGELLVEHVVRAAGLDEVEDGSSHCVCGCAVGGGGCRRGFRGALGSGRGE